MHDRIANWVARLLAHPAGFVAFNAFTLAWFAAPVAAAWLLGDWKAALAVFMITTTAYLDVVTWFSSATQFTIAYQNDQAALKLDAAIDTLLQLAHNDADDGDVLIELVAAVHATLTELAKRRGDSPDTCPRCSKPTTGGGSGTGRRT